MSRGSLAVGAWPLAVTGILASLLLGGCSGDAAEVLKNPAACRNDLPVGGVETAVELGEPSEGIAFGPELLDEERDGLMYVAASHSGTIWGVTADGGKTKMVTLPSALGIAFRGEHLFVAGFGTDEIYRVGDGTHDVYAGPISKPNFVTVTPWGSLLVSNDYADAVSEITDGHATLWTGAVPSPNGMAFSAAGDRLYVVTTFADNPGLWQITLDGQKAGAVKRVATFAGYPTPDGIAVSADGAVYVALNTAGKLVRVDPVSGAVAEVAAGLQFPASLAFGRGDFDPCSVYVTQLFGKGVHRVNVGVAGARLF